MSLSSEKQTAVDELVQLMTDMRTREQNADQEFAERFFNIIEKWMKEADIKYNNGLSAPNGAVTGIFNGNLQ